MKRFLYPCALIALTCICSRLPAAPMTLSDTTPMIDWYQAGPSGDVSKLLPGVLPFAIFDFGPNPNLATLDSLTVTLSMQDGDSAFGNFDYDDLSLGLGWTGSDAVVDTGLKLNGFPEYDPGASFAQNTPTLTFTMSSSDPNWLSSDQIKTILTDIQDDGQIWASIIDADGLGTGDWDNYVLLYSAFDTALSFTGESEVPEPTTLLVWSLGLGGAWVVRRRRLQAAQG